MDMLSEGTLVYGARSVGPAWRRVPKDWLPAFVRYLYGRMHSNPMVEMFSR